MASILVIDDDTDMGNLLRHLLIGIGYDVISAPDGASGVALAHDHQPDLILMDADMPVMDGFQATKAIRNNPDTRHIPIIGVSALTDSANLDALHLAGCNQIVPKPLEISVLLDAVEEIFATVIQPSMQRSA